MKFYNMRIFPSKFFYNLNGKFLEFVVDSDVYYPEEDSILFADTIIEYFSNYLSKTNQDVKKILEVGCGCGFLSIVIYKLFENKLGKYVKNIKFVAVDINRKAIYNAKINAKKHKAKISFKCSNLFENIKEKFDLIIFNSPYLPVEEDYSYSIFQKGENIVTKFLINAKKFMNNNSVILLLTSSITPMKIPNLYKKRIIKRKKIDWEELRVYEIKLR